MEENRREEARNRYITGEESLRTVAGALGLKEGTLQKWCREGGWVKEREKFRKRAARKAVTLAVNRKARELSRLLEASECMETALLHAARAFQDALKERPELVTDGKFRSGNLRNLSEALERQTNTTMKLAGLMTAAEKEKLALAKKKLEMEERREKQAREGENTVRIILEGETEELAE